MCTNVQGKFLIKFYCAFYFTNVQELLANHFRGLSLNTASDFLLKLKFLFGIYINKISDRIITALYFYPIS